MGSIETKKERRKKRRSKERSYHDHDMMLELTLPLGRHKQKFVNSDTKYVRKGEKTCRVSWRSTERKCERGGDCKERWDVSKPSGFDRASVWCGCVRGSQRAGGSLFLGCHLTYEQAIGNGS